MNRGSFPGFHLSDSTSTQHLTIEVTQFEAVSKQTLIWDKGHTKGPDIQIQGFISGWLDIPSFCQEAWRWWSGESSRESRKYTNEQKFQVYEKGIFYATKNKFVRYLQRLTMNKWKVFSVSWFLLISANWYFSTDLPDSMGKSFFPVQLPFPILNYCLPMHKVQLRMLSPFFSPGPWVMLLTFSYILYPLLFYVSFSAKGENNIQK